MLYYVTEEIIQVLVKEKLKKEKEIEEEGMTNNY